MVRKIFVLVAAAAFAMSSFAHAADNASDRDCTREELQKQEATVEQEVTSDVSLQLEAQLPVAAMATLEKVFAVPISESIETEDGVMALVGPIEFVIARIGPDGKPITACVDNAEAARKFFTVAIERLPAKRAQDE